MPVDEPESRYTSYTRKPDRQAVERRAYAIYLEHGGEPGHELENWLQAEQELSASENRSIAKTATA